MIDKDKMPDPILITGAARSGTSMVAGSVCKCGAFGGNMRGPNKNNAKGMYENVRIINNIVKPYLRKINVDPLGQYPLPDIRSLPIPADLRDRVQNEIIADGYTGGPWFYKGAKLCLIWPVWHYAFPDAKWIIVRRKPSDIANSCCKTGFMAAFRKSYVRKYVNVENEFEGWKWWVRQHHKRFMEMNDVGVNMKFVWPDRMVRGDYRQLYDTIEWLGLKWNEKAVLEFIDPKLWKSRQGVHT